MMWTSKFISKNTKENNKLTLFTELAKKKIKDDGTSFVLAPFSDVLLNKDQHLTSNYKFWFNNPEVTKYNNHGLFPYNPLDDAKEFLKDTSRIIWSIILSNREKVSPDIGAYKHIGNVSLQKINLINRSAEIACIIGEPDWWGKGAMTWACNEIIKHGFLKLGLNRIWSGTAITNIGMNRVFEKLGFIKEGTFRNGMYLDHGFVDVNAYGLLFYEPEKVNPRDGYLKRAKELKKDFPPDCDDGREEYNDETIQQIEDNLIKYKSKLISKRKTPNEIVEENKPSKNDAKHLKTLELNPDSCDLECEDCEHSGEIGKCNHPEFDGFAVPTFEETYKEPLAPCGNYINCRGCPTTVYEKCKMRIDPEDKISHLINWMQEIRSNNNKNWMDLVRLAFKANKEQASKIMKKIANCDSQINQIANKLGQANG